MPKAQPSAATARAGEGKGLSDAHPAVLGTPKNISQFLLGEEEHQSSCGTVRCFTGFFVFNFLLMISSIYRFGSRMLFPG